MEKSFQSAGLRCAIFGHFFPPTLRRKWLHKRAFETALLCIRQRISVLHRLISPLGLLCLFLVALAAMESYRGRRQKSCVFRSHLFCPGCHKISAFLSLCYSPFSDLAGKREGPEYRALHSAVNTQRKKKGKPVMPCSNQPRMMIIEWHCTPAHLLLMPPNNKTLFSCCTHSEVQTRIKSLCV